MRPLWPLPWVLVFRHAPETVGLVGPVVAAVAALCALRTLHRALCVNHRHSFTTARQDYPGRDRLAKRFEQFGNTAA